MKVPRHGYALFRRKLLLALQKQLDFLLEGAAIRARTPLECSF
jgi:hypothetical protein